MKKTFQSLLFVYSRKKPTHHLVKAILRKRVSSGVTYFCVRCQHNRRVVSEWLSLAQMSDHMVLVCEWEQEQERLADYFPQANGTQKIVSHFRIGESIVFNWVGEDGQLRKVDSVQLLREGKQGLLTYYLQKVNFQ